MRAQIDPVPIGRPHSGFPLVLALLAMASPHLARAACKLARIIELPVTMVGMKALVPAKINGDDVEFVVDSGAFYSMITPASAAEFKLHLGPAPYNLRITGIGGSSQVSVTTVHVFTLANQPLHDVEFLVGGGEVGEGTAGTLGQNVLRYADTEYDFANGAVRIWRPEGCRKSTLAYWATSEPYSVIDIKWTSAGAPHTIGTAYLNGQKIRVMFDTGAAQSMLTLRAAERAGFNPGKDDARSTGVVRGIGFDVSRGWVNTFASFKIGNEEIRNAQLHIADIQILDVDMLLGADFFLSHRVYVATSQEKLYFTYNGGPIFNLSAPPRQASAAPPPAPSQEEPSAGEPTDAAGFARRGTAFAARREFAHAIEDLTRACELDPQNAQYFYERGKVRLGNRQPALAMDDFNRALELAPSDVEARVSRAALRIARHDNSGAAEDLDAADRLASREADIRFGIGTLDIEAGRFEAAVAQFDFWIANHADDSRKPEALNDRCWARAELGRDLKKALSDCNVALRLRSDTDPTTAGMLDSRALAEQRLGDFAKAIEDYDAALRFYPKNAWFLYSRGVAELKAGRRSEGRADIASAVDLQPNIVDLGRSRNVTP